MILTGVNWHVSTLLDHHQVHDSSIFSFSTAVFASFLLLEHGSMDEWPVRRHHISSFKKFPNSKSFGLTDSIVDTRLTLYCF